METRQLHIRELSTVTGIQQFEHAVQSIYFLGLEDFEGDVYISIESDDYSNEAIPLTNNTLIIGQPMTLYNTTYTCQIYGVLNDGEKIQLSQRFRLIVYKSNDIQGDSEEYPVDPNFENSIIEFVNEQKSGIATYTDDKIDEIEATGDAVIASIPSDYTALEQATYNAYPTQSETGNPIYFDDGADDIPVKELIVNLEPKQSGTGDPSPSNVRAISGYDGVTVKRTGKNLLGLKVTNRVYNGLTVTSNTDGSITVNGTCTDAFSFSKSRGEVNAPTTLYKGVSYTLRGSGHATSTCYVQLIYLDASENQVSIVNNNGGDITITPTEDLTFSNMYFTFRTNSSFSNETFYPQLQVGSSITSYEPYQTEQEYSITFPSSVGTVYGGTLNMTTGVLTVDRALVDMGSLTWTLVSTITNANTWRTNGLIEQIKGADSNDVASPYILFDRYDVKSYGSFYGSTTICAYETTGGVVFVNSDSRESAPNGQLVYTLATPTTVQLTPTEVTTLLGSNTISSDGSINLTYRADISKVIEKLTNAIVSLGGNV